MNTYFLNFLQEALYNSVLEELLIPIILLVIALGFTGFAILWLIAKGYVK